MDAAIVALALAGACGGVAAMALPGVHVSALALAVLALAPGSGPRGAAFLLGALAGAPFGLALGGTFLGATSDDEALASLPAHAMAREGRAAQAVALQAWGAFAGLAMALPLALAVRPLLALVPWSAALPWLLLGILVLLVVTEKARPRVHRRWREVPAAGPSRKGRVEREAYWVRGPWSAPAGMALAALVLALSGWLGWLALRIGSSSPLGLPSSSLLPLLAGLFAVPSLVGLLRSRDARRPRARLRVPRPPRGELLPRAAPGALVASLLGLVPGVTASHVATLLPPARTPERALARLGAVNGAAVVFGLLAWHALGKARHGALLAAQRLAPPTPWPGWAPPSSVVDEAALVLLAAGAACLLARFLAAPLARAPPRPLAAMGLALVVGMTLATCGAWGLAVLGVGAAVGQAPRRLGVRRGLLMGCVLVPALLRAWGAA